MLESRARVVERRGDTALVELSQQGGCSACTAGKACGAALLSRLLWRPSQRFEVANPIQAGPGDEVIVAIEDGKLLRCTIAVFARALVLLIAGAVTGSLVGQGSDAAAAAGAVAGLAGAWFVVRRAGDDAASRIGVPRIVRAAQEANAL